MLLNFIINNIKHHCRHCQQLVNDVMKAWYKDDPSSTDKDKAKKINKKRDEVEALPQEIMEAMNDRLKKRRRVEMQENADKTKRDPIGGEFEFAIPGEEVDEEEEADEKVGSPKGSKDTKQLQKNADHEARRDNEVAVLQNLLEEEKTNNEQKLQELEARLQEVISDFVQYVSKKKEVPPYIQEIIDNKENVGCLPRK